MDSLHQSLAECGFANQRAAVVVADRAGDDFGRAGGAAVGQHDQWRVKRRLAAGLDRLRDQIVVLVEIEILVKGGTRVSGTNRPIISCALVTQPPPLPRRSRMMPATPSSLACFSAASSSLVVLSPNIETVIWAILPSATAHRRPPG